MSVKDMEIKKKTYRCMWKGKWYVHHKVMKADAKLNYNDRNKTLTTAACIGDLFFFKFYSNVDITESMC